MHNKFSTNYVKITHHFQINHKQLMHNYDSTDVKVNL